MKEIAIYNIKGGVGKTATSVNLAYAAAEDKNKVLLVDMDPQGASTFYMNVKHGHDDSIKKTFFKGKSVDELIRETEYSNLDILPSDTRYRKLDSFLGEMKNSDKWLKKLFKPVKKEYDYVIIDCPPNVTALSETIFQNADAILVPVIPTTLSVRTYEQLRTFFKDENFDKDKLHPFFSMVERRKNMHNETMEQFHKEYKECINVAIPYNAEVEKMGEYKAPIVKKYPYAETSEAFRVLWKKIKSKV
ncbi:MAG TPA: AAA family ATPase [Bacteroidia bacterium]